MRYCRMKETLKQIILQSISYFKLDSNKRVMSGNFAKLVSLITRDYLLGPYWL